MFDVIISGGAMIGATLALALDQQFKGQLKIAVVEAFDTSERDHPGFDARAIALSDGTTRILAHYGLWEALLPLATPISHIHVSDQGHAGMTDIKSNQLGVPALGYVVELADVGRVYATRLQQCPAITMFCPARIHHIERTVRQVNVTLTDATQIEGKLLVAADGNGSTCCELLGLPVDIHDFEQVAIIANVETGQPHQGRAFERFTSTGPVALLPMTNNRMSMVWCMRPDIAASRMQMEPESFLHELQQTFGWRLGKITRSGTRSAYPLKLSVRSQSVSHRFAVVGNAAQTLHPIAGQGFNLGIRDVATLVDCLKAQSRDWGDVATLLSFQRRRTPDRQLTIMMTSSLVELFSNQWFPAAVGRNLGLMLIDNIPPFKQPLLKRTLGYVSR